MEWQLDGDQDPTRITVHLVPGQTGEIDPLYPYSDCGRRTVALIAGGRLPARRRPRSKPSWATNSRFTGIRIGASDGGRAAQRESDRHPAAHAGSLPGSPKDYRLQRKLSPTGIPACALGLDRATVRTMRWAMRSWSRAQWLNRIFGTRATALQIDYAPILSSAGFFTIGLTGGSASPAGRLRTLLTAGKRMQRFWLTATRARPRDAARFGRLSFAHYGENKTAFTADPALQEKSRLW